MKSGAAQQLLPDAHMASIGGTITHSPNTSGSDICWVLFHSSDINPIHQLFCQLPLSGLRGDCSFEGSEYCFILAPHLLLTKFDWIFLFLFLSLLSSYFQVSWVARCPDFFFLAHLLDLYICIRLFFSSLRDLINSFWPISQKEKNKKQKPKRSHCVITTALALALPLTSCLMEVEAKRKRGISHRRLAAFLWD